MRVILLLTASLFLAMPAHASGAPEAAESKADPSAGDTTQVELPMLVAPVTVDGRLYFYAYMRIILKAKDASTADLAREKVPFILDAMLRETHRATITLNGDPQQIDGKGLEKRLFDTANAVIGAGSFESLTFRDTIQTDDPNQVPPEPGPVAEAAPAAAPAAAHH
jgi:hypothetical protein